MDSKLNQATRERDEFREEAAHLRKKMKKLEEDEHSYVQREVEMKRDIEDAKVSVAALREFEVELNRKEKMVLSILISVAHLRLAAAGERKILYQRETVIFVTYGTLT
jgi:septal ring factor EnvC (AmiA/AmiB activator)